MLYTDGMIDKAIVMKQVKIDPFEPSLIQPASIDLRLGPTIMKARKPLTVADSYHYFHAVTPYEDDQAQYMDTFTIPDDGLYVYPDEFLLGHTLERITLPDDIGARVEGKSTLGRWGLVVHVTAGFIDPGFSGQITLEIKNLGPFAIRLSTGMRISQLALHQAGARAQHPYRGKYQNQDGVQAGR